MQGASTKELVRVRRLAQRQRAAVACARCRLSKKKCNEYRPCKKCTSLNVKCVEDSGKGPDSVQILQRVSRISTTIDCKKIRFASKRVVTNVSNMIPSSRLAVTESLFSEIQASTSTGGNKIKSIETCNRMPTHRSLEPVGPSESLANKAATTMHNEPFHFTEGLDGPNATEFQATPEPVHRIPPRNFDSNRDSLQPSTQGACPTHINLVRSSALRLLPGMQLHPSSATVPPVALAFPSIWRPSIAFQMMHSSMLYPNPWPSLPTLPFSPAIFPPAVGADPFWVFPPHPAFLHPHPFFLPPASALRRL